MRKPKHKPREKTDLEKANYRQWQRLGTLRRSQINLCSIATVLNCQNLLPAIHAIVELLETANKTEYELIKLINKHTPRRSR